MIKKIDILDCDTYEEEFVRYIYENNKCRRSVETKDIESAYKHFSEMKSGIQEKTAIVYGAVDSGVLLGFVWASKRSFREDNKRMFLNIMYVDVGYKNCNVCELLLDAVKKKAKSMGHKALFVYEEISDNDAVEFYKEAGFEIERIQLVKNLTGNENKQRGLAASPEFIEKNLSTFAKLYEENIHAHVLLENFSYDDAVTAMNKLIQYLKDEKASVYYECNGENVIGMIWVHPYKNMCENRMHLSAIVVQKKYKGNSYGQKLFSAVYNGMIEKNLKTIYTNVDAENSYATKFYYKQGFEDEAYQMVFKL